MTDGENAPLSLRYDPRLIEETVFLVLRGDPEAERFHNERNQLYEMSDTDERERAFQEIHRAWFLRLGLADQIEKAGREFPLLASTVALCVVVCALRKRDEGAELFIDPEERLTERERRTVRILLKPESFLDPLALLAFLRRELLHITDMLDPRFDYEPDLPVAEGGPAHDHLIQDRYRTLWDTTIGGRMVRRGWAPPSLRDDCLREFLHTFPMLGDEVARIFSSFFDEEHHTHKELVIFADDPAATIQGSAIHPGSRCPLCHFPTYVFEPNPECLPTEVISRISKEFPNWRSAQGLCQQCADLYRTGLLHNIQP